MKVLAGKGQVLLTSWRANWVMRMRSHRIFFAIQYLSEFSGVSLIIAKRVIDILERKVREHFSKNAQKKRKGAKRKRVQKKQKRARKVRIRFKHT